MSYLRPRLILSTRDADGGPPLNEYLRGAGLRKSCRAYSGAYQGWEWRLDGAPEAVSLSLVIDRFDYNSTPVVLSLLAIVCPDDDTDVGTRGADGWVSEALRQMKRDAITLAWWKVSWKNINNLEDDTDPTAVAVLARWDLGWGNGTPWRQYRQSDLNANVVPTRAPTGKRVLGIQL